MTTTILPSRRPYGSPSYSPNSRPIYYGGASGGSAAYPLSFSALGLTGVGGWVFDGSASSYFTDSAGTTVCVTAGSDPIGYVQDLSGNNMNATQSTSANKPVYVENNGIKGWQIGNITAVRRYLNITSTITAGYTRYVVTKRVNATDLWFSMYDGVNFATYGANNGANIYAFLGGSASQITESGNGSAAPFIYEYLRSGTGANEALLSNYDMTGTIISGPGATGTQTYTASASTYTLGSAASDAGTIEVYFDMVVEGAIDPTQKSTIRDYIVSTFGGLT